MSKTVEKILCGLRDFGSSKLAELDSLCSINQEWLSSAVEDVKRQIVELGPAVKKQKVGKQRYIPSLDTSKQVR